MKLLNCHLTNFGSYKSLEFDFSNLGLSLVYGATGSGKSSLLDAAPWVLFGATAKGGKVDDVRSWQTDEPTEGMLTLRVGNETITVKRMRGGSGQNDLLWWDGVTGGHTNYRGKDIKDTQRLLNERLGVTPDLYLAAAYASEFSPTARFFTDTAKRQREIFDLVADLSFPITLAERASNARKDAKKELEEIERSYAKAAGRFEEILRSKDLAVKQATGWEESQARVIKELEARAQNFEAEKAEKLKSLWEECHKWDNQLELEARRVEELINAHKPAEYESCPTCGRSADNEGNQILHDANHRQLINLKRAVNPYKDRIEDLEFNKPGFEWMIKAKKEEVNPHAITVDRLHEESVEADLAHGEFVIDAHHLEAKISSLGQLVDLSGTMRGTLLTRTVYQIQEETNRILDRYFDGEIMVNFSLEGDSLDVFIRKNGYSAVFSQLSKGQRQLLKLSFMISVMKASSNESGIKFDQLFFDEALDGLDSDLKVKAYSLFQELSGNAGVLVIEHDPGLRELFDSRYHVTLEGGQSVIEHE